MGGGEVWSGSGPRGPRRPERARIGGEDGRAMGGPQRAQAGWAYCRSGGGSRVKRGEGATPPFSPFVRPPPGPVRRWRRSAIRQLFSKSVVRCCRQPQCEAGQLFGLGFC